MTRKVQASLQALYVDRPPDQVRILINDQGKPVSEQNFRTLFSRAMRLAGFEHDGVHILRHTFCSHLAMRGVPAIAIKELAGHTTFKTTERYMHLAPSVGRDAIKALEQGSTGFVHRPLEQSVSPTGFEPVLAAKTSKGAKPRKRAKAPDRRETRASKGREGLRALLRGLLDELDGD